MEPDSLGFETLKSKFSELRFLRRHSVERDVKDDGTQSFIFQPHTFRNIFNLEDYDDGEITNGHTKPL